MTLAMNVTKYWTFIVEYREINIQLYTHMKRYQFDSEKFMSLVLQIGMVE